MTEDPAPAPKPAPRRVRFEVEEEPMTDWLRALNQHRQHHTNRTRGELVAACEKVRDSLVLIKRDIQVEPLRINPVKVVDPLATDAPSAIVVRHTRGPEEKA